MAGLIAAGCLSGVALEMLVVANCTMDARGPSSSHNAPGMFGQRGESHYAAMKAELQRTRWEFMSKKMSLNDSAFVSSLLLKYVNALDYRRTMMLIV